VGSEVVKALREHNATILAATREPAKTIPGAKTVVFDYTKPLTVNKAMIGIEKVFLVTPFDENMVQQTRTVLGAAKQHGVKHIVKLSAIGADTDAHQIAQWHHDAERALEESGIAYTHLRANGFMQNYTGQMAGSIKNAHAIYAPAGDAKVSFIDVRDIADAAATTLLKEGHENKIYTLTGPQALSHSDIAKTFTDVLGVTVTYTPITDAQARDGMIAQGMPEHVVDALIDLFRYYRTGDGAVTTKDVQQLSGRAPTNFRRFVEEFSSVWK
jgi:uncharacterized protein YbjT (DUF2867 family)